MGTSVIFATSLPILSDQSKLNISNRLIGSDINCKDQVVVTMAFKVNFTNLLLLFLTFIGVNSGYRCGVLFKISKTIRLMNVKGLAPLVMFLMIFYFYDC